MLQEGFATKKDFEAFARNLARDPKAVPILQQGITRHLANQPPDKILNEFDRLQKVMVSSKMLTPEETADLAAKAKVVSDIADKGLKTSLAQRFQRMLLMTTGQKVGGEAGKAVGGAGNGE
jgi:hypothetical protein